MTEILLVLLLGVFASLLAAEWLDWVPRLSKMAIRAAARRLPAKDRARYHEEWSAVAEEIPGRVSRLLYSLDLIRASYAMSKRDSGTRGLGMKRVFDIVFGSAFFVLIVPLFVLICWRVSRSGPIFDRVLTVGRSGKLFERLKFRTMVPNHQDILTAYLEEHPDAHAEWIAHGALRDDPRLTSIGAFLKRTSMDDLPQLVNVLRGDMSLVGPRPASVDDLSSYGTSSRHYIENTPGLIGPAQLTRDADRRHRIALDVQYEIKRSFWYDLVLLVRTMLRNLRQ